MNMISLKLSDRLLRLVEKEAKARRATKSEVIRDSIESTLGQNSKRKQVSCYDLSKDLIGTLKGPSDLGTNPKYMEGYGE